MKKMGMMIILFGLLVGQSFSQDLIPYVPDNTCYDEYQKIIDTIDVRQKAIFAESEDEREGIPMSKSLQEAWDDAKKDQEEHDGRISSTDLHPGTAALLSGEMIGLSIGITAALGASTILLVPAISVVAAATVYTTLKLNRKFLQAPYKRMRRLIEEAYAFDQGKLNKKNGLFRRMAKRYGKQFSLTQEEALIKFSQVIMSLNEDPETCSAQALQVKDLKQMVKNNNAILVE